MHVRDIKEFQSPFMSGNWKDFKKKDALACGADRGIVSVVTLVLCKHRQRLLSLRIKAALRTGSLAVVGKLLQSLLCFVCVARWSIPQCRRSFDAKELECVFFKTPNQPTPIFSQLCHP